MEATQPTTEAPQVTQASALYPVDAPDYGLRINLRDEETPLWVEHVFRRLPLKDPANKRKNYEGECWLEFERRLVSKFRVDGKDVSEAPGGDIAARLWLWNVAAATITGYPPPLAESREAVQPVTELQREKVSFFHKEKAAYMFLDAEFEIVTDDAQDDLALLLGDSLVKLRGRHLGYTFYLYMERGEEHRIYFDEHIRHRKTQPDNKATIVEAGIRLENVDRLFDRMFRGAEQVSLDGMPYIERDRTTFLSQFCPYLKKLALFAAFAPLNTLLQD